MKYIYFVVVVEELWIFLNDIHVRERFWFYFWRLCSLVVSSCQKMWRYACIYRSLCLWSFTNKDSCGVLGRNSPCAFVLHAWCARMQKKEAFVSCRTFFRTFFAFQLLWKVHSVICRTVVMWWHLGCHPYLVVASAERSSCVNLDFFMSCYVLVFIEAEIEKLTWNVHEHTTVWLVRKKQPMCSCFVAWCTSVAKNVLF